LRPKYSPSVHTTATTCHCRNNCSYVYYSCVILQLYYNHHYCKTCHIMLHIIKITFKSGKIAARYPTITMGGGIKWER
jgi:ribosomal protein S26